VNTKIEVIMVLLFAAYLAHSSVVSTRIEQKSCATS